MTNLEKFKIDLRAIALNARQSDIDKLAQPLLETMSRYQINTRLRQAHFLAQILHESGELYYKEEIASGSAYEGRKDLGNTRPGDGKKYKGRSIIQVTGRANYSEYDRYVGANGNIIDNPELLATDPAYIVDPAGWFWQTRNINPLADRNDIIAVTRRINGGTNGLAHRRMLFARANRVLKTAHFPDPVAEEPQQQTPSKQVNETIKKESVTNNEVQEFLNQHIGSRLVVDGIIGPKSKAEIKKLQGRYGLSATGNLTIATKNLILRLINS